MELTSLQKHLSATGLTGKTPQWKLISMENTSVKLISLEKHSQWNTDLPGKNTSVELTSLQKNTWKPISSLETPKRN